jgi:hypothetical protein
MVLIEFIQFHEWANIKVTDSMISCISMLITCSYSLKIGFMYRYIYIYDHVFWDVTLYIPVCSYQCCKGRAIAQAISCWLPTTVAQVRTQVRSCGIYGGYSGTGAGFPRVL